MRILVTGGRTYANYGAIEKALEEFVEATLIHGACPVGGADWLADRYAVDHGWPAIERFPVDHTLDGPWPGAGPRRNQRMLSEAKPDLVIAFPGGKGTRDMIRRAQAAGIPVRRVS